MSVLRVTQFGVIKSVPVEIWKEIFDHILYDPVIFLTNPFYSGCNPHSALHDWTDATCFRKLEHQRGLLRLVSRSWKVLADATRYRYFQTHRSTEPVQSLYSKLAFRVEFQPYWGICGCVQDEECAVDALLNKGLYDLSSLATKEPLKSQIIELGDVRALEASRLSHNIQVTYPDLKSLVVFVDKRQLEHFLDLFTSITFLSLVIGNSEDSSTREAIERVIALPVITFQLDVSFCDNTAFLLGWEFPLLKHLSIKADERHQSADFFAHILRTNGQTLLSLRIEMPLVFVSLPPNLWTQLPALEYLGLTATDPSTPPTLPYPGHPLRTIGVLEPAGRDFRREVSELITGCENLLTVGDCHNWKEMPEDYDPSSFSADKFDHAHDEDELGGYETDLCWICVQALHSVCLDRGIEYMDHAGITYDAFLHQITNESGSGTQGRPL